MKAVLQTVLCLTGALTGALGQCEFGEQVSASNISIETTGGITYLKFSYSTVCPQQLWKKPAEVFGSNITQAVFLMSEPNVICTYEYPPTVFQNQASLVIGRLDPGDYLLSLVTAPPFPGWPWTTLIAQVPFTVPSPQPTLSMLPSTSGKVVFRVNGTSNVAYEVESSLSLTDWEPFQTFTGAPFTVTNQPTDWSFFRVKVSDGVPLCPQ